jgi:hypothetical protein
VGDATRERLTGDRQRRERRAARGDADAALAGVCAQAPLDPKLTNVVN